MASRRIVGALAALVGLPIVALLVAIAAIAAFGVSIDASRWRELLAERAGAALGRTLRIEGPLELGLGRTTVLRFGDLRILNAPGFAAQDFATIDSVQVRIDSLAVLRGRLHVRDVALAGARVRLARADDGHANWTVTPPPADTAGTAATPPAVRIDRLSVRNLVVEHHAARDRARPLFELEELVATENGSLKLTARGRSRGSVSCSIDLEGAATGTLRDAERPWPFTLDLACPRTRLHASGELEAGRRAVRFGFGAGVENLDDVASLLEHELPGIGAFALTGTLAATADAIELAGLRGVLGDAAVTGALALQLGGVRPRLTGELAAAELDLHPFLHRSGAGPDYAELSQRPLPLRTAPPIDVDVALRAQNLVGLGVRDVRLAVHADAAGVRAPLAATVDGVPLDGRVELDLTAATPALALAVGAEDVPLAAFAERFAGVPDAAGRIGSFALRLESRGETLGALVRDLDLRLDVAAARLRYGERTGGRPIELAIDALEVAAPRGQPLRATSRGTLLGASARMTFRGGTVAEILRERATPLEVELAANGATARVSGTLARPDATRGTDLAFRLDAPRAGTLARWLGTDPGSKLPVALRGRMRIDQERWQLRDATLKLGRSELTGDVRRVIADGKPITVIALRSPLIDVSELASLRGPPKRGGPASGEGAMLPQRVRLADADVRLDLARVVLGRNELVEVGLGARIRDGQLAPSPWAARFAGVPFAGRAALDMRGDVPELSLSMAAQEVDVGALLRTLRVAEIIDERAVTLEAELAGRGSTLRDLLDNASLKARLTGGSLTVRGPAGRAVADIRLDEVVIGALPGQPVTARLDGTLNETPTAITVSGGTLADFARASARMPFAVEASAADTRLALGGEVALPLGHGGELTLELGGERLDSLSGLARAALPPWGPWTVRGPIAMTPTGYEVPQLTMRVGESRLYGSGRLELAGVRPHLRARVRAPHLQLDDFPVGERQARRGSRVERLRATARDAAGQTEALLSRAFLRRFDASIEVEVQQVRSGADRLGDGKLGVELVDGHLDVEPLVVNLPGGGARLYASYDTREREVDLVAGARVEGFEYGVLARRNRPDADIQGLLSLDMEIRSTAPSLDAIFARADGHIDFAVWPKNLRGGVFDRWSVNMFLALLPFLDPGTESQVNCFVGRLDLDGGILTHDALVIDTTRVRALGSGRADLRTEEIAFRFRPRAKGAAFFSLQTPLSISGTMTDFKIAPTRGDFAEAFARMFASVITLPLETLIHGPLPRDGADVCADPLRPGIGEHR